MGGLERKINRLRARTEWVGRGDLESRFDIQVDPKFGNIVMICANGKGRRVVEDMWPDVEWSDLDSSYSSEWLFTHIRVTRLPPHLERRVPLKFVGPEALGFAVACALHRRAWPLRVAWFRGEGADISIGAFAGRMKNEDVDFALYADYVPPNQYTSIV